MGMTLDTVGFGPSLDDGWKLIDLIDRRTTLGELGRGPVRAEVGGPGSIDEINRDEGRGG
jgi:hypothetical protein